MASRSVSGWQTGKTVLECNRYMLDNEISTDVCFEVGPPGGATVFIRAHTYVLMSRSEVFEALFNSGMIECRKKGETKIRIEDIQPEIFQEILRLIYYEEANVITENAVQLLYAAKKYLLPKLAEECCICIKKHLDASNVLDILQQSLMFDEEELRCECLQIISVYSEAVLKGAELKSVSRSVLENILCLNEITSIELKIFEACVNWAKHQIVVEKSVSHPTDEQIRDTLGNLLYKIRFPTMDATDFAKLSIKTNILSPAEKESIYYYLVTKEDSTDLMFSTKMRSAHGKELFVDRTLTSVPGPWRYQTPTVDAINFKVDTGIVLSGVGLFGGQQAPGYEVDFEILESENSLFKRKILVPYSKDATPWKVSLENPIVIKAGNVYSIKALAYSAIGHYNSSCKAICTTERITVTFISYIGTERPSTQTNETYGQIPRLYFSKF